MRRSLSLILIILVGLLAACGGGGGEVATPSGVTKPANAVEVTIIYAPESARYMPEVIDEFNRAYASGKNPVTGQNLASGEKPIYVTDLTAGKGGSSGTVMQGIVNAIIAPNNQNVARPVIFEPSVSHWLALANYQSGRQIFNLAETQATALAPVVMAIWESRLEAIRRTVGRNDIGWGELLAVLNSPNGWQDYGIPNGRRTVYYGHTDPFISSTALSTLIAEFYASARDNGFTGRRLTLDEVNDPAVQDGVRSIEQLIRHYSRRTTEFIQYIAQGPEYLDFVALEENDLVFINEGKTEIQPPEKLVALYLKEGTFWHEHPFGIVNADWVTDEQKEAARVFTQYVLTPDVQKKVMAQGFRPANPDVELGYPFVPENGVTPEGPATVLDVPAPEVIAAIQQSWSFVKKQADIMLLIDVSGSMSTDNKLEQAKQAAIAFLDNMEPTNRVGLAVFSSDIQVMIAMDNYEANSAQLRSAISALQPQNDTELYEAVREIVGLMNEEQAENRIRAVVLLSDGADTGRRGTTLNDATQVVSSSRNDLNPVILIPVAYGADADVNTLSSLARASSTRVSSGDPQNILGVLEIISSYF